MLKIKTRIKWLDPFCLKINKNKTEQHLQK